MTLYFDGISALAIDLVGTLIDKPAPHFYGAATDFLAKHASHATPDGFRRTFRRCYWEHSIGNYQTDRGVYLAVPTDLFLTYGPKVEALTDTLTDIYLDGSPAFADASRFLQAMCRRFKLVLATKYVGPQAKRILESNSWLPYFDGLLVSRIGPSGSRGANLIGGSACRAPLPARDLRYWTMRRVFVARWPRTFVRATNARGRE